MIYSTISAKAELSLYKKSELVARHARLRHSAERRSQLCGTGVGIRASTEEARARGAHLGFTTPRSFTLRTRRLTCLVHASSMHTPVPQQAFVPQASLRKYDPQLESLSPKPQPHYHELYDDLCDTLVLWYDVAT